ncbi:amidohydrolase [Actinopolymorpha singaporensis]|uniref:Cytosine deaminase n=1 Tax=Actinopolymorpha singaporensis TaxID=117157 RepID=A0A1H1TS14_9ACTN|nr:amidohydrolase [Actinopolymorpha singaporensis]SDS62992.1 cytosine deaminase [Actinopolymorpha singaporensis]
MSKIVVRNVRPWGGDACDIHVDDGSVVAVEPTSGTAVHPAQDLGGEVIDGRGLLAIPSFVNAHAHLDKTWWGKPWVPYGGESGTQGRIAHERARRDEIGIPDLESSTAMVRELVRTGTTVFRSHVDVDLGVGLDGIHVVREAVAAADPGLALTVVAFPQDGVLRRPGVLDLLDRAAAEGADLVGGLDPASIDRDPVGQLDALFDLAERRGVGLDIHLHDSGELGAFEFELIVERTKATGMSGQVTIAHGFALGDVPPARQRDLVERLAGAGVSLTTVAPITAPPLPLDQLRNAGVPVGLGTDGIRDLWGPFGDGDMLRLAGTLARLAGWRHDGDLRSAVEIATCAGAGFGGRAVHDLVPGAPADIVLLDAENLSDAVTRVPSRDTVLVGGRVVVGPGAR